MVREVAVSTTLPFLHHDDLIAIGRGKAQVMGDQDGGHAALAREFHHEFHHGFLCRHIEAGGRLVRDQQLRTTSQRQRDHDALAHAAGEFERIGMIALAWPRDADLLKNLDRPSR